MKSKVTIFLALILLVVGAHFAIKTQVPEDTYIPIDTVTPIPTPITVPLNELGVTFELPEGWTIGPTNLRNAWAIDSPADSPLGILIQPEGYYYHNASADDLQDYASSYRSDWDLQIVVDYSEPAMIDGESALFQMFRAGDSYVNGVLDTTSIASIYGPSPRYIVQHPESKEFIIISDLSAGSVESFRELVKGMRFIKE